MFMWHFSAYSDGTPAREDIFSMLLEICSFRADTFDLFDTAFDCRFLIICERWETICERWGAIEIDRCESLVG